MISTVVTGRLESGVDPARVQPALDAIAALRVRGMSGLVLGRDLRLRRGGWDFAITADFVDEAAYRAYDLDEEHTRVRRDLFAPLCAEIVRVQVDVG